MNKPIGIAEVQNKAQDKALIGSLATEVERVGTKKRQAMNAAMAAINAACCVILFQSEQPLIKWGLGGSSLLMVTVRISRIFETKESKLRSIQSEHGDAVLEEVIDVVASRKVKEPLLEESLEGRLQERILQRLEEALQEAEASETESLQRAGEQPDEGDRANVE